MGIPVWCENQSLHRFQMPSTKRVDNDRFVSEEGVLHASLLVWYPDSFFHWRCPIRFVLIRVRPRALGRLDLVAVLLGETISSAGTSRRSLTRYRLLPLSWPRCLSRCSVYSSLRSPPLRVERLWKLPCAKGPGASQHRRRIAWGFVGVRDGFVSVHFGTHRPRLQEESQNDDRPLPATPTAKV